jgi:hypothetical protein
MLNLFRSNNLKYSYILIFSCFLFSCAKEDLKINSVELCEYFNSEGICKETLNKNHTYTVIIPKGKRIETWEALSNHLYFKSRQTPGILIRFNRKFTPSEKKEIYSTYFASFDFQETIGKVEGQEIGEDWIGSFQYLGSMLKEKLKSKNELGNYPNPGNIFPIEVKYHYESSLFNGDISFKVNLKLENE